MGHVATVVVRFGKITVSKHTPESIISFLRSKLATGFDVDKSPDNILLFSVLVVVVVVAAVVVDVVVV